MDKSFKLTDPILVTGKNSRFCFFLKKELKGKNIFYTTKKEFNINNISQMSRFIKKKKIKIIIHIAALSRPMIIHEKNINKSVDANIIGTANISKLAFKHRIKVIYFSTNYIYPCKKGNYKESDPILPVNNYAWSKLGGEASVHMLKKFLILRLCMTEYPFIHKYAISGAKNNFLFNKYVAKIIPYILNENGVLNIGGKKRDIYEFAKMFNKNKKIKSIDISKIKNFPKDSSININKIKNILALKKINYKNFIK
jgi:dTDP-4-dehydrorhamnose reductase